VRIFAPDLDALTRLGDQAKAIISRVEGIADLRAERMTGLPQLKIEVDRAATGTRRSHAHMVGEEASTVGVGQRNYDLGGAARDVRERLERELKLPAGYFLNVGGRVESQERATRSLLIAISVAVFAVFILLYLALGSTVEALVILATLSDAFVTRRSHRPVRNRGAERPRAHRAGESVDRDDRLHGDPWPAAAARAASARQRRSNARSQS
jgi:Cu/Ag efflux pump CusA